MEESEVLYFKCDGCGEPFEPYPDSFITLNMAEYIIPQDPMLTVEDYLKNEGTFLPKNSSYEAVPVPEELSNIAVCLCQICHARDKELLNENY